MPLPKSATKSRTVGNGSKGRPKYRVVRVIVTPELENELRAMFLVAKCFDDGDAEQKGRLFGIPYEFTEFLEEILDTYVAEKFASRVGVERVDFLRELRAGRDPRWIIYRAIREVEPIALAQRSAN